MKEKLSFVAVGHVDHGKSTLIGRLLFDTNSLPPEKMAEVRRMSEESADGLPEFAFIMDHLEEERNNRVTIDTAQIFFKTERREYVIIDAPGHKQFLKNMITGASQAEAAVLLIDAQEGLQEQTHRHAYILSLLGLSQVIVVMNKMDLVNFDQDVYNTLSTSITAKLADLGLEPMVIVPISAQRGDNVATKGPEMAWYDGPTLLAALDGLQPTPSAEQCTLRMPIQDIYDIDGQKVLAGRMASGVIHAGQTVMLHPLGKTATVETIKIMDGSLESAQAGESIGLVFQNKAAMQGLARGQVICPTDDSPHVANTLTATVFWMNGEPLNLGDTIELKCGTAQVECKVKKIRNRMNSSTLEILEEQAEELRDTEVARLTLKLSDYIATDAFEKVPELGRFVLMRDSDTVAGGIVN